MKILGVDLSLSETGICLYVDGAIETGTIKTKVDTDRFRRYNLILQKIKAFEPIDLVIIESYAYGAFGGNNYKLIELGGIVRNHWHSLSIPFVEVGITSLKKVITGNGRADKDLMIATVKQNYGYSFTNNNECDSFCLVQYFLESKQWATQKH